MDYRIGILWPFSTAIFAQVHCVDLRPLMRCNLRNISLWSAGQDEHVNMPGQVCILASGAVFSMPAPWWCSFTLQATNVHPHTCTCTHSHYDRHMHPHKYVPTFARPELQLGERPRCRCQLLCLHGADGCVHVHKQPRLPWLAGNCLRKREWRQGYVNSV